MAFDTVILKKEGHIATITLNRPRKLNAINHQMVEELKSALADVAEDREIRVLVLTGAGKGFCAGGDIGEGGMESELAAISQEERRQEIRRGLQEITRRLYRLDIPTIAMINGAAAGAGLDWALACDIRIGSATARMGVAFTKIGVTPVTGGAWLLPRLVGVAKAAELIFTADFIEAEAAREIGLLNRVTPSEKLEEEAMALANRIAQNPPLAVKMAKMQLNQGLGMDLDATLELAATCNTLAMASEDHKEGVMAFRQKREPIFKGR